MSLEGTEFTSSLKNVPMQSSLLLFMHFLPISFGKPLSVVLSQTVPKTGKIKTFSWAALQEKILETDFFFKLPVWHFFLAIHFYFILISFFRFLLLNIRVFLKCYECKYAHIDWDCHVALLHLQLFKINQKCLGTYMLYYPPHLIAFWFIFLCLLSLFSYIPHEGTNGCI